MAELKSCPKCKSSHIGEIVGEGYPLYFAVLGCLRRSEILFTVAIVAIIHGHIANGNIVLKNGIRRL